METVKTGRKILLLIILLSPLAICLDSCKKEAPIRPPDNNSTNTLPILTTTPVSSFTATSAITGGKITSDGGLPILSRGVVWSTISNPTVALSTKTTDGTGTGSFISNLSGLSLDTNYFVRAYATTSLGTAYGNEISFKFSSVGNQNSAPKVNAGLDMIIELHQNFTVLQGGFYNADRSFKKVEWRKVSGPDSCIIVDKDSLKTVVSNLREGVYEFELTVTDKMNLYGKDSVRVEVVKPKQQSSEIIFKNLVWTFPWYNTLEIKNIYTYIPTGTPIKVFVQRDNASEWKEASPESNNVSNVYEYYIETKPNGNNFWTSYGSFYVFYFGRDTDDTPDVKIQF
jgi:hypothetical protein